MYRILCLVFAVFYFGVFSANAIEKSPSVFYPLPTQTQGKVYAAKSLFVGDAGGIWLHDVHGKIRFFDGQAILPRQGSILSKDYQQLVYLNNAFWTVLGGSLNKISTNDIRTRVVDLPVGTVIDKIGVSGKSIWMVSKDYFYTYNTQSLLLESYSLKTLTHFDKSKRVVVNDATFGISKWVLATNSGVFLSENHSFSHVPRSGDDYVETLFFSEKRREMLVGTLDGVLLVDLNNKSLEPQKIAKSHVLSIAETENEYWIGTENGLFVHSLVNQSTTKLKSNVHSGYSLKGHKIFSLVNDAQGGIWIASEKGVFYYSMFGQKFNRVLTKKLTKSGLSTDLKGIAYLKDSDEFLLTTSVGVTRINFEHQLLKDRIYDGQVNDSVLTGNDLWLATDEGLVKFDITESKVVKTLLPLLLTHIKVDRIEVDSQGEIWGVSGNKLWSYNTVTRAFVEYGDDWIVDAYLPATITQLKATRHNGIIIGTEHGTYSIRNQRITFNSVSSEYGQNHSVIEDQDGSVWFASDYGVYKQRSESGDLLPIMLAEDSISPKCLMETSEGIWLSSSRGLTLYSHQGLVKKQFGEPYGLINNEFLPSICASSQGSEYPQLVIGSALGIVKVSAEELSVSSLPHSPVIISQIKVDNKLLSVGGPSEFRVDYGRSLSLTFGALPQTVNLSIEYKLTESSPWLPIEGSQLTLEHLRPGHYQLLLRSSTLEQRPKIESYVSFRVIEPWYLSMTAFVVYVLSLISLLIFVVWWRSRMMMKANHLLQEQVDLKTSQLRHQSKIVLSNNLQLRKQIQVRHALLENILLAIEPRLEKLKLGARDANQAELETLVEEARIELEQVKNVRSDSESTTLTHNLSLVLESVVSSWSDEFGIAGMILDVEIQNRKSYVELQQFNLDVIFNALFAEAMKRLSKSQTLIVRCYEVDASVFVTMSDQGISAKNVEQTMTTTSGFALNQLSDLVEQSGGDMNVYVTKEQNIVQLSWPIADIEQLETGLGSYSTYSADRILDDTECQWLNKVEQLVVDNFSDAEFSTANVVKIMFMSERSFQRRFKMATGKTFKEYLNEVRLEKACQRLLSGEKVSQAAFECGFNDPSYFSQRFKHHFGLSPTQFIDEHQD
ncbi:helix-turn-helix domain-containing protein [Vibrio diazotrophicus]|uniref:helix-turn-helix domain-containing protein n=1 Tax=Vibrio diazotrophicus TaxID=685 RepID=UPI00142DAABD|nr:helix-turn-helix domain-containing protein [Vibrio diazotrophicus]NIY94434.1 helix-turn-helix domain-containing protein [Vibrio diazotrophicus]